MVVETDKPTGASSKIEHDPAKPSPTLDGTNNLSDSNPPVADITAIKHSRRYSRQKVTRKCGNINSNIDSFSKQDCTENIEYLRTLEVKLNSDNETIVTKSWGKMDENSLTKEMDESDTYEKQINLHCRMLSDRIKTLSGPSSAEDVNSNAVVTPRVDQGRSVNKLKLPEIPLPKFSNKKGENLTQFFINFEGILIPLGLNNFELFVYLEKQLEGEPFTLVTSLTGTQRCYTDAKDLMMRAFARPINQKFDILKRLSNISFDKSAPYSFIGEMRMIVSAFEDLKMDTQTVLQYFIWNALPVDYQNQFVHLTNTSKPPLKDIQKYIFDATERVSSSNNCLGSDLSDTAASLAANVIVSKTPNANSFKPCCLCNTGSGADHQIHKCQIFETPEKKIEKLKLLELCFKCGGKGHLSRDCRFKFRQPCVHCKKNNHFSYLCFKETSQESIGNGVCSVELEAKTVCNLNGMILPTLSGRLQSGSNVRILRDSGAQATFIRSEVAQLCNFKTVKTSLNLTIKGFNSIKKITTNIVQVELLLNSNTYQFPAVCVPVLSSVLTIDGVADMGRLLIEKGYKLADTFLIENPSKPIDMVLGVDSFHILKESQINFGYPHISCMYNTAIGVMPIGNVKNLCDNIKTLPAFTTETPEREESVAVDSQIITVQVPGDTPQTPVPKISRDSPEASDSSPIVDSAHDVGASAGKSGEIDLQINNFFISCDITHDQDIESMFDSSHSDTLNDHCARTLNYDDKVDSNISDIDQSLCESTLENIERDQNGRLIVPLLWQTANSHLLANNFNLCQKVLHSILKKVNKITGGLEMVDNVIKEQIESNVVERIEDLSEFLLQNHDSSFLAHMPVFKLSRNSTKCRVVYLSNMAEKARGKGFSVSHNQAMMTGPCLNRKLETSVSLLRFDPLLLIFDLQKAFLQLKLTPDDQNKVCFLWFRDACAGDFTIVAYRCLRVPFGLRCSPALLMLSLFYILVHSVDSEDKLISLKQMLYELFYMDNGAITGRGSLVESYLNLNSIFKPFGFKLQDFVTNDKSLRKECPDVFSGQNNQSKLLGMLWNTDDDTICSPKLNLDAKANTKRKILSTIASNFDIFNIGGPILNRARLFLHDLQCDSKLGWDISLEKTALDTWKNIAKQVNNCPLLHIPRFVGNRDSNYEIIAYVDASKQFYGATLFILDKITGNLSFLMAKNRMITNNLKNKSIPSLELLAINFGVEVLHTIRIELAGSKTLIPIKIDKMRLFTDSSISLSWLRSFNETFAKMNKKAVFVMNRLASITKLCTVFPIEFGFIAGKENPADCITRPMSYKMVAKSSYWKGSELPTSSELFPSLTIPDPRLSLQSIEIAATEVERTLFPLPLLDATRVSSLRKLIAVHKNVLAFISKTKIAVASRGKLFQNFLPLDSLGIAERAQIEVISRDQNKHFLEVIEFLKNPSINLKDVPPIVNQLNIIRDSNGLLRVKCKISYAGRTLDDYPLLLAKTSQLAELIVRDLHRQLNHSGKYSVLAELRKRFYIPSCFSFVRKILRSCVTCRRFNSRSVELNQNDYRTFRTDPSTVPFRNIFIDYLGPITITIRDQKTKVYLLLFTCLYSRAVNLQICLDLTVGNFLRAFQLHIFKYGLPSLCLSDLGSQIVAGSKIITEHLSDEGTTGFLSDNGIKTIEFSQYPKGCNKLGGLVEVCVKLVKRLLFGAIGNNIVKYTEFEYLVAECNHLVNRRPIGFKEPLRDSSNETVVPVSITPEMIVHGHELITTNIIPDLEKNEENYDPPGSPVAMYSKLSKIRNALIASYSEQFIPLLIDQATNVSGRYTRKRHHKLAIGDVVLVKEHFVKRANLPMAIVTDITENAIGEVTSAVLRKGGSREIIERHVGALIPLLETNISDLTNRTSSSDRAQSAAQSPVARPKRAAAVTCARRLQELNTLDLI